MANVEHVQSGAGAPAHTPPSLGAHYTDTQTETLYIASGIVSPEDWRPVYSDSGWITLNALNGFEGPPEARMINGVVYLRGSVWVPLDYLDTEIAELPEGWRPGAGFDVSMPSAQGTWGIEISHPDWGGGIKVRVLSGDAVADWFNLSGISFPAG